MFPHKNCIESREIFLLVFTKKSRTNFLTITWGLLRRFQVYHRDFDMLYHQTVFLLDLFSRYFLLNFNVIVRFAEKSRMADPRWQLWRTIFPTSHEVIVTWRRREKWGLRTVEINSRTFKILFAVSMLIVC